MNEKRLLVVLAGSIVLAACAYLLFLSYALLQLKSARETGMARINEILDGIKADDRRTDNPA